jgi:hypothetical protein
MNKIVFTFQFFNISTLLKKFKIYNDRDVIICVCNFVHMKCIIIYKIIKSHTQKKSTQTIIIHNKNIIYELLNFRVK